MRRARRTTTTTRMFVVVMLLVAGACSGGDEAAPSTQAPTTAAPTTTTVTSTTTAATTTTTTSAAPTTTAPPSDQVGSPEALEVLITGIVQELRFAYPDIVDAEVPIPDLTNPDPVVAVEELNLFGQWVNANYPANEWNQVRAYPESPESELYERNNETLYFEQRRLIRNGDPWAFLGGEVVDGSSLELPSSTLNGIPNDSVAVLYRSSSGPVDVLDAETGEIRETIEGWESRQALSVVVPTGTGWVFWDTLLDFGVGSA